MRTVLSLLFALGLTLGAASAAQIRVVAAENFYGDVAEQLGGEEVQVTSILSNPDQDPHLFEASASTARAIAAADIVILNGADYDPWMAKLIAASPAAGRDTVDVAALLHRKPGDNPHLWYEPAAMPLLAKTLAALFAKRDPAHRAAFEERRARFEAALKPLQEKVAALKARYAGVRITATEPVFGYMAAAIGLEMRNERFQTAIMNGTEPSASQIAAFQKDLRTRAVRVLLYNNQTSQELTDRMRKIAEESGVAVIGVGETKPAGIRFQDWMLSQLQALEAGLARSQP